MWKAVLMAVCLLVAGVHAMEDPAYGVKLCGREFIRAVIFTCGGSRWRRSLKSADLSEDLFSSHQKESSESWSQNSVIDSLLQRTRDLSFQSTDDKESMFSRPARSFISEEILEALRKADRKGRDVVVGLSNACCKWGCSKSTRGLGPNVMATLGARWLLSILLVNLPTSFAPAGPPARPSTPQCCLPYDENVIHCVWDPGPDTQIPSNYSLYWKPTNSEGGHMQGTRMNGFIPRRHFISHSELHVWVQAENQHGTAKSEEISFNTANIIKPPTPNVIVRDSSLELLEIGWNSNCPQLGLSEGSCEVRHRKEADHGWLEEEGGFYGSYTLESPEPCTVYEFQVRCACNRGLMSDWSKIHIVQSAEAAPKGVLDIWKDCEISSTSFNCFLTWKKLPKLQACGHILGYEVGLTYSNGTAVLVNLSIAKPRDQLVCDKMQCHFTSSLNGVSSMNVSAFRANGATLPAHLAMPVPGEENAEQAVSFKMNAELLSVSWDLRPQLSDNLKEYVVQYKQVGHPLAQGFDWVRVNKNQTTAILKGQFENYTAYKASLFAVSYNNKAHHVSSVIIYSLQGIPSRVPSLKVISIDATHVTLTWEPVPLPEQNGVILYYQVGVDSQNVYNVSASPPHENKTFVLQHLSPGQEYEVWIRAVTVAGPGASTTQRFKTKDQEGLVHHSRLMSFLLVPLLVVISCVICCCLFRGENRCSLLPCWCYEKVPDPRNSHIFKQMEHQFNGSLACMCGPVLAPHPKISQLEVVEIQLQAFESCLEKTFPDELTEQVVGNGHSQTNKQNNQMDSVVRQVDRDGTGHRYGREDYSKMIDSDEERDRKQEEEEDRDDSLSSSEDGPLMSGYEKHFMPTALEVLEV
ncbi:hypothetical protein LDENG_00010260 [Lucifuga dentata]|nr:hypothetical protein LDENG_00010260 [Lucifuga dentata]